ncbi:MAG: glycosyltransferase family 4 protein [Ignavibacteriaceae bacterium]|nr:glycosyltransferase family 4 protein [Ignavibacteriaceae bacterium]
MPTNDSALLFFLKSLNMGGVETSTIRLVKYLKEKLKLIGIWASDGILKQTISESENIQLFLGKRELFGLLFALNLYDICRVIYKNRFNVIHYHFRVFTPYIYFLKILFPNIKILYTHHNVFNDRLTSLLIADTFVAVSESTLRELHRFKKNNAIILKHGIEIKPLKLNSERKISRIGFVGRFCSSKGIFLLLEAFKSLLKTDKNLQLILRGEGELKEQIEDFIHKYYLEKNVRIEPPEINSKKVFKDIELLVLPSTSLEGFGLVIIEAMNEGIPVLVSDLEVFKEIVNDNKTGFIFRNNDIFDLTAKLNYILSDKPNINSIVISAHKFVEGNFNIESNVMGYMKIVF